MATKKIIQPIRVNLRKASEMVSTSANHLRKLVSQGLFTQIRDREAKQGSRIYLLPDELEVYALHGLEALQSYRRKMGRIKEIKKKEKQ